MRALALLILLLATVPAEARRCTDSDYIWTANPCRHQVWAFACDRVTGRCVWAVRYFKNPTWR